MKGKIPAGPDLTPGMKDLQVALLRQRLGVRVEAAGNNEGDPEHYDAGLEAAVVAFKESQKLAADGTVDAATRRGAQQGREGRRQEGPGQHGDVALDEPRSRRHVR